MASRRRLLVLIAAVIALAAAVTVVVLLRRSHPPADPGLDPAAGRTAATAACADLARVRSGIEQNANSKTVLADASAAVTHAELAQRRDPRWVQLYSATLELSHALNTDTAAEASQALQIVATSCPPLLR
jgi:hypothetical protein